MVISSYILQEIHNIMAHNVVCVNHLSPVMCWKGLAPTVKPNSVAYAACSCHNQILVTPQARVCLATEKRKI